MTRKGEPKKMANQNSNLAIEKSTEEIEAVLARCSTQALAELPTLGQAITLAQGLSKLRAVMTEQLVTEVFMPLQGSALGFLTDKDSANGYPAIVVRECLIEAMIHGLRPVGNEFNIIAGRTYAAQAGYRRLVSEYPGLTDLVLVPGVPYMAGDKGALVPFRVTWRLNGKPMQLIRDITKREDGTSDDTRIPVRVNAGMGADGIVGKATRKVLKAVYEVIAGSQLLLVDGEVIDTIGETSPAPASPDQDGRRIKMGKNGSPTPTETPAADPPREPGSDG